jgi:hypothetical protein
MLAILEARAYCDMWICQGWRDLTLISTCCSTLKFSQDLLKPMLGSATMRSMVTVQQRVLPSQWYISKMIDIYETIPLTLLRRIIGLSNARRAIGRTLSEHLVCSCLVFYSGIRTLTWSTKQKWEVINACVIMLNMVIKTKRVPLVIDDQPV